MNVLIVDDEQPNREGLRLQLHEVCPEIRLTDDAASAEEARERLKHQNYDIVFLDIHMPKENGFEFLQSLPVRNFCIVFVTAYSEYAIRAFKANAVDYILKPVDSEELAAAIEKCKDVREGQRHRAPAPASFREIGEQAVSRNFPLKLTLPYQQGFHLVETDSIIWIEADGNYSMIRMDDNRQLLVTRAIREFEFLLDPSCFFRSHKSAILNLNKVREYSSTDGHTATMINNDQVPVSRRKLDEFMAAIDLLSKRV